MAEYPDVARSDDYIDTNESFYGYKSKRASTQPASDHVVFVGAGAGAAGSGGEVLVESSEGEDDDLGGLALDSEDDEEGGEDEYMPGVLDDDDRHPFLSPSDECSSDSGASSDEDGVVVQMSVSSKKGKAAVVPGFQLGDGDNEGQHSGLFGRRMTAKPTQSERDFAKMQNLEYVPLTSVDKLSRDEFELFQELIGKHLTGGVKGATVNSAQMALEWNETVRFWPLCYCVHI